MSATERTVTSDWIMTASGRPFWPLEPRLEDIAIEDIAHHLSNLCRFTGAVRLFYSVAQHSVEVSLAMAPHLVTARHRSLGLYGLLHDGSEAYLMDVPRPLKHDSQFAAYRAAEARLQRVIYAAFGLDPDDEPAELKLVDRRMLRTEQRDLMPPAALAERRDDVPPFDVPLTEPWSPTRARWHFLDRFVQLTAPARGGSPS